MRHNPFCDGSRERWCTREIGEWSAADDMVTTVEQYAQFMIRVMRGDGLDQQSQTERLTVHSSTAEDPILACPFEDNSDCPRKQGHGLGWEIFEFADATLVSHGGADWSERAMAYFVRESQHGIVLFLNAANENSIHALIEAMEVLDSGSRMAAMYRGWVAVYKQRQAKQLNK